MAECLKKPFKDSLEDIKERMKYKRNQKWMKLGRTSQVSAVKCKITTSSSKKLKSIQANNRALAEALQEEKLKLKDAQATILQLSKECLDMKVQMCELQRCLRLKEERGLVESQLSALNEIISKVSQNLLDSIGLLVPVQELCCSGAVTNTTFVFCRGSLQCADQALPSGVEADGDRNKLPHFVADICKGSDNAISSSKILSDKGQAPSFHLDNIELELENVPSSGEEGFGNALPKNVSTRRPYSRMSNPDRLCAAALDPSGAPHSAKEPSGKGADRLGESLEECAAGNINTGVLLLNKVGSELVLRRRDSDTAQSNPNKNDLRQRGRKSGEGSRERKEKQQKGKGESSKSTSGQRPKKKKHKEASKEKLDFLGGSSDAYNFDFEESIHVTPFRQHKANDADAAEGDKSDSSGTATSDAEEDSDDSLYEPYKSKSKKRKDASPIHTRPRSKRCQAQREQKLHSEKETEGNKSSDKAAGQPAEPPRHLSDVTNTPSLLPGPGHAKAVPEAEGLRSPKRKRSCTLTVNYKEPSIAGKLRRGDPFTDTNFLDSPIFKHKKEKCHSLKKKSLSKYNEKFVGC
ncbi:SGO1 protein, partial [Alcedo cyanopectus]|nr:SGO1 protein [Ceyx cyanopectus]